MSERSDEGRLDAAARGGGGQAPAAPDPRPEISLVVPAFNEEKLLADTLSRLWRAVDEAGLDASRVELVVCDNASTDATPRIARDHGARVVVEPHRQIARARNTGARAAGGRYLIFVDADTWPSGPLLARALELLRGGAVCGGGVTVASAGLPLIVRILIGTWNLVARCLGSACGAFVFCDAAAFRAVGGFDETLYAAEEVDLSRRLARHGASRGQSFRIITEFPLETSMRKIELYSAGELTLMALRGMLRPIRSLRDRRFLGAWYDGRR